MQSWILFDLGGVVVDISFKTVDDFFKKYAKNEAICLEKTYKEKIATAKFMHDFHLGLISEKVFFENLSSELNQIFSEKELCDLWQTILKGENIETVQLLKKLKKSHNIGCLSNSNVLHWNYMAAHYDSFQLFEKQFASHELHLEKPNPKIFEVVQKQLGCDANQCLLIDDLPYNVEAARVSGWQAILFQSAAQVEQVLNTLVRQNKLSNCFL